MVALAFSVACGGGGGEVEVASSAQPPGQFAFVANRVDNTVSSYAVDADTGGLRPNGYTGALIGQVGPSAVAAHPNGRWVYTLNAGNPTNGSNISVYIVGPDTGELFPQIPAGTGEGPYDMAFAADGEHLYVSAAASNSIWTYSVSGVNGQLTLLGPPVSDGASPTAVAWHPNGRLLFAAYRDSSEIVTYRIDSTDGTLASTGDPTSLGAGEPAHMALSGNGRFLYVADRASDRVLPFSVDSSSGELEFLSPLGDAALGGEPTALELHPGGRWLYAARSQGSLRVFEVSDQGVLTIVDDEVKTGVEPVHIAFGPSDRRVYVTNRGSNEVSVHSIDFDSGELSPDGALRTRSQPTGFVVTRGASRARRGRTRFLYVANEGSDTITSYALDEARGRLTFSAGNRVLTGLSPRSLCADPLGRFVLAVNVNSPSVSSFRVNTGNGRLSRVVDPLPYSGQPRAIAIDPSGRFAFVANAVGSVDAFGIDPSTGALDFRGTTPSGGQSPEAIAVDPTGQFILVSNVGSNDVTAIRFDQGFLTAGQFQVLSRIRTVVNGAATRIRFSPDGRRVYLALPGFADQVLPLDIDAVDGSLTIVSPGPSDGDDPVSVDIHPSGQFGFAAIHGADPEGEDGEIRLFELDPEDGALRNPVPFPVGFQPTDLLVGARGRFLCVINRIESDIALFQIEGADGNLAQSGFFPTDSEPVALATICDWR